MQRLPRLVGPRKAAEMSVNGEPVGAREALRMGLVDEVAPSGTALRAAFQAARVFIEGRKKAPRRDWDALAARQKAQLKALLKHPTVQELMASAAESADEAADLRAARRFAARYAIKALDYGYRSGFKKGLKNDAKLFGEVAASPSGQEWIRRFIEKDPRQSSFLTILSS
jgi:enoyl-CoA hydratase/carnithine racemase